MIRHLEAVMERLLELVGGWMCALAMTVVVALAALAFLGLNLYKFDRESFLVAIARLHAATRRGWSWLLAALLLLALANALTVLRGGLIERLSQEGQAQYITSEEPTALPTVQRAPKVSFLDTATTTRRLELPPELSRFGTLPDWNPEQARYNSAPAVNVSDQLSREDDLVIINRTVSVQRYLPTRLLKSQVELALKFRDRTGWRREVYQAAFVGHYTLENPFAERRRLHFDFPLPENSGTLSDFHFKVNGQEMPSVDIESGLEWEAELAPHAQVEIEVAYCHNGSQSWTYDLTARREPISDFQLTVTSDRSEIKFERGSLYPSRTSGGKLVWDLRNQITSQSVSLYFPYVPLAQMVRGLYVFAPLAAMLLGLLIVTWSRLVGRSTSAWRATLAVLASCGGYCLASYLISYVPLASALSLAFLVGGCLQWQVLGRRLWLPVVVSSLAPFTFLAAGHTGVLLTMLGLVTLGLLIHQTVSRDGGDQDAD